MSLGLTYHDTALSRDRRELPGVLLEAVLERVKVEGWNRLQGRLEQACGKLCLMWQAADCALQAEEEFWISTIREAPALFGNEAVTVDYHLEAFVLFARSALDIGATIFGELLPAPFLPRHYDSFNRLLKQIMKSGPPALQAYFLPLRDSETSWVSVLCGCERGRSLRDKITHQTEFPLEYVELNPRSEKRYAVVLLGESRIPLPAFVDQVRNGVATGFEVLEGVCAEAMSARQAMDGPAQSDRVRVEPNAET